MNVGDVRDGLRDALSVIPKVSVYDRVAGSVNPPAVILGSPTGTYDLAFGRAAHDMTWPVWLVVASAADGQLDDLDRYLVDTGDYSVRDAINSHATTAWDSARVTGFDQYGVVSIGGIDYVGCVFNVELMI